MSVNLDFLRAYAVLVVLAAHLIQNFNNNVAELGPIDHWHFGRWGVLVFFVHTSLVLMQSLERTPLSGIRLAGYFYLRRAFRIYPLSILAVALCVAFGVPSMPHLAYERLSWAELASNYLLTTNLTESRLVLVPLWSLPYEVQMYVFLPLLYWVTKQRLAKLSILALFCGSALVVMLNQTDGIQLIEFVPCFAGGIAAFVWLRDGRRWMPGWTWPLYIICMWLLFAYTSRNGWIPCFLLGLGYTFFREIRSVPVKYVAERIAKYSYGIYLSHLPLIWLSFRELNGLALWQQWLFFAVTASIAPLLLYHFLEQPLIRLGSRVADRTFMRKRPEVSPAVVKAQLNSVG
jgi:peptidoglycan/LPS O-acetylase OafA/YrhL